MISKNDQFDLEKEELRVLKKYMEFVERVNELGFMYLNEKENGYPSVAEETDEKYWFTGNEESDPWCWKDICTERRMVAYGELINGIKGFVSKEMYPYFYAIYKSSVTVEERWFKGKINDMAYNIWKLLDENGSMSGYEIKQSLGVSKKNGLSRYNTAIKKLVSEYSISLSGAKQRIDKQGKPYGTPSIVYTTQEQWGTNEWRKSVTRDEAIELVIAKGMRNYASNRKVIEKILGI